MNLFTRNSPYYLLIKYLLFLLKHSVYWNFCEEYFLFIQHCRHKCHIIFTSVTGMCHLIYWLASEHDNTEALYHDIAESSDINKAWDPDWLQVSSYFRLRGQNQLDTQNSVGFIWMRGTAVAQWLRCCATNRKVAGTIPDGVSYC